MKNWRLLFGWEICWFSATRRLTLCRHGWCRFAVDRVIERRKRARRIQTRWGGVEWQKARPKLFEDVVYKESQ